MSKRLEVLKASLQKKQDRLAALFRVHFDAVKQANGQPLNDKRNGQATINKWERQSEAIRNAQTDLAKTALAIEREEAKLNRVETAKETLPKPILDALEAGEIVQWAKHPHTFFVSGVDKARIVWMPKKRAVAHKFFAEAPLEQKKRFAEVYNNLFKMLKNE
jgi:hypothetical protein